MPKSRKSRPSTGHHSVYVVYLRNPKGDGKAGYYVGMTGLSPEQRFDNHKNGVKAARVVRRFGERLVERVQHVGSIEREDRDSAVAFDA